MIAIAGVGRRPLVVTIGSSGLIQGLSIVTGIVLSRVLGPDQRGELGTVLLWPSVVASIAILGLPEAVSVLAAAGAMRMAEALGTALRLITLLSVVAIICAAGIIVPLSADMSSEARTAAVAFLAFIPINMATLTLGGGLSGRHQFGALNAVRVSVIAVAAIGLPLLAVMKSLTVGSAAATYLTANLVALAVAAFSARRLISAPGLRPSKASAEHLLGYGVRSQAGVVAGIIGERLDQLVISLFLPSAMFGLYLVAVSLSAGTAIVSTSISTVLVPIVAAAPDVDRLRLVRRYLRLTFVLTAAIAAVTAIAAPAVVTVIFGPAFAPATVPAQVLLVGTVPLALSRALAASTRAAGRPWSASRAEWLSLVVAVPAYVVLLPLAGLTGAALASVLAYTGSLVLQAFAARPLLGARSVRDLFRRGAWEPRGATFPI